MSTQDPKWEKELRNRLREHEFAFDPAAWTQMAELLDGAAGAAPGSPEGGPAPTPPPTTWTAGLAAKVIAGLVLIGIVAAVWRLDRPTKTATTQAVPPPTSELLVTPGTDSDERADAGTATGFTVGQKETTPPTTIPSTSTAGVNPLPLRLPVLINNRAPTIELPIRLRQPRIISELPGREWRQFALELPPRLPADSILEARLRFTGKRKRNRKTLFPDVIEKY